MSILKFPLSKITFAFLLGILCALYLEPKLKLVFVLLVITFFFLLLCFYLSKKDIIQKKYFGIFTFLLCFWIGNITQIIHMNPYQSTHYIYQIKDNIGINMVELTITEKLKNTVSNQRYIAQIRRLNQTKSKGCIILNIKKDSLTDAVNLPIGSNLLVKGVLIPHKQSDNPDQFNYGKYLENKSIFAQVYVQSKEIKVSPIFQKNILYYAGLIRDSIIFNLRKEKCNTEVLNIIHALILGQQQDLSWETLQDYQHAGAIHILAVSGLHVGCILLFIHFILRPLSNTKTALLIKLILIILFLWLFAIIAGLSPSVVRSVTMFSFVAVGMHLNRNTNIYHTLIISILVLLFFQPSFLFDVGFQLSYISLFFIVWFQPLLLKLWLPKNKILLYFWNIITISFAAQTGCSPLSFYYFHQFPSLFFVTNLIIIPFLGVLLIIGIITME